MAAQARPVPSFRVQPHGVAAICRGDQGAVWLPRRHAYMGIDTFVEEELRPVVMLACRRYHLCGAMPMTGTVIGYDPGGDGKHGLARATVRAGNIVDCATETVDTVEKVVASILSTAILLGLGVDTLTCWGTGPHGWRPADRWLRHRYPEVQKSIVAPNSLYGAMSINGMAALVASRQEFPDVFVTETHPKVLYYAQFGECYSFKGSNISLMNKRLSRLLAVDVVPRNEHEWDAAISTLAVVRGLRGAWRRDLHALAAESGERLVQPCGGTAYIWPE